MQETQRHKGTEAQRKPASNGPLKPVFFVPLCLCAFVSLCFHRNVQKTPSVDEPNLFPTGS